MRAALIALGTTVLGYGVWLLLSTQALAQIGQVVLWAGTAVLVHDALLVPVVVALAWSVRRGNRLVPVQLLVVVVVLLGPVTLAAIPVFVGLGADPGMPTLLGRNYPLGWVILAVAVLLAGGALARSRVLSAASRGRSGRGADPRGR